MSKVQKVSGFFEKKKEIPEADEAVITGEELVPSCWQQFEQILGTICRVCRLSSDIKCQKISVSQEEDFPER